MVLYVITDNPRKECMADAFSIIPELYHCCFDVFGLGGL